MAERRMFAKTIIDSDAFLDMPISSRLLYYDLAMRADDDGFVNSPKKIVKIVGASNDDLKLLFMRNFIIPFESGVVVIKHWKIHNYIRKDTYNETPYTKEKSQLKLDENKEYFLVDSIEEKNDKNDSENVLKLSPKIEENSQKNTNNFVPNISTVDEPSTQVRIGKVNINIYAQMFNAFWSIYPKKKNKAKSRDWYLRHKPSKELHEEIILSLYYFKDSDEWKKNNGQFIPYPTTFLSQRRWEDLRND